MHRFYLVALPSLVLSGSVVIHSVAVGDEGPATAPDASVTTQSVAARAHAILRTSCYSCHGSEEQESGLRLDSRQRAVEGGDGGQVILPGDPASSRLLNIVSGKDQEIGIMPPEGEGTQLSTDQIRLLRIWIEEGAHWPARASIAEGANQHWSFQPISNPKPPSAADGNWAINQIDQFVLARLESAGIRPAPQADRATLIKRLYLDLLGTLPTPNEVNGFVDDPLPNAYVRLVDRLFASPHFGERWGRHWLDLARYADSDGYEKDRARPHAWRYRNWVIDALNADLPFDQFTIEQIAGDMLPGATTEQRVASGFHRNTLHNTEGGTDPEEDRVKKTVDRTNTLGTIWLGLTVGCCQCHTHKYDPLTQREYYSLYAFFNSMNETDIPAPPGVGLEQYQRAQESFEEKRAALAAALHVYEQTKLDGALVTWQAAALDEPSDLPPPVAEVLKIDAAGRTADQRNTVVAYFKTVDPEFLQLKKALEDHAKQPPPVVKAQTVVQVDKPRETYIHIRGDFLNKGQSVSTAAPAVLHALAPRADSADRLDLAHWLVTRSNPLTARVTVNRIWQRFFGRGIVKTIDDFGSQGNPPSHPLLLDWLASEFHDSDWSAKHIQRAIVLSSTYRQSSVRRPELVDLDPENGLLARQTRHRVESEVIRDLALGVAGLLDKRIGGPSVRPKQPTEYSALTYANSARWQVSSGGDAYRRGLYTFFQRTSPYPMLMTFDSPDATACCAARSLSNTPLQALTLWNDPVFFECAQEFGKRVSRETGDFEGPDSIAKRSAHAFQLALARVPDEHELAEVIALYKAQLKLGRADPTIAEAIVGERTGSWHLSVEEVAGWIVVGRTIMNLDEFITKE